MKRMLLGERKHEKDDGVSSGDLYDAQRCGAGNRHGQCASGAGPDGLHWHENDDYRAYLEENGRFNPRVWTESADVTDDAGQTWPAVYRLVISDNGLIVHGLSVGDAFSLDANLLTDNGWTEISREYDGDFSFVYEKVVGEATYRLAVQTLNMNVSSLDYSVDNLEAHLANRAAEAMEE